MHFNLAYGIYSTMCKTVYKNNKHLTVNGMLYSKHILCKLLKQSLYNIVKTKSALQCRVYIRGTKITYKV